VVARRRELQRQEGSASDSPAAGGFRLGVLPPKLAAPPLRAQEQRRVQGGAASRSVPRSHRRRAALVAPLRQNQEVFPLALQRLRQEQQQHRRAPHLSSSLAQQQLQHRPRVDRPPAHNPPALSPGRPLPEAQAADSLFRRPQVQPPELQHHPAADSLFRRPQEPPPELQHHPAPEASSPALRMQQLHSLVQRCKQRLRSPRRCRPRSRT